MDALTGGRRLDAELTTPAIDWGTGKRPNQPIVSESNYRDAIWRARRDAPSA